MQQRVGTETEIAVRRGGSLCQAAATVGGEAMCHIDGTRIARAQLGGRRAAVAAVTIVEALDTHGG